MFAYSNFAGESLLLAVVFKKKGQSKGTCTFRNDLRLSQRFVTEIRKKDFQGIQTISTTDI